MKMIILSLLLVGFTNKVYGQSMKGYTWSERRHVKNVIKSHKETPVDIRRVPFQNIEIEFSNIRVILKPDGFIGEVWLREENYWLSLGTEE
jgi:hypothetical protein